MFCSRKVDDANRQQPRAQTRRPFKSVNPQPDQTQAPSERQVCSLQGAEVPQAAALVVPPDSEGGPFARSRLSPTVSGSHCVRRVASLPAKPALTSRRIWGAHTSVCVGRC
jgi:hypothetical protein